MPHPVTPTSEPCAASHRRIQVEKPRQIRVLGVPLDLGASRRGVDMDPRRCAWRAWRRVWRL